MTEDLDPSRPFRRETLRSSGLDERVLRTRDYVQVLREIWVHRSAVDRDTLIRAALCLHGGVGVASHFSAAQLLELPVPRHEFAHVTVFDANDRRYRPEIKSHVTSKPRGITTVRGIPTTDATSTFIELSGWLCLVDRVVLGDAICKKFGISCATLLKSCEKSTNYYAGLAREAAAYVRDGVDSPMESRLRMLIVLAGLPEPIVNYIVRSEDGAWAMRFDLYYAAARLLVEYDGRQHADDAAQWRTDIDRREELDRQGRRLIIVTAHDVYGRPQQTLKRIRQALIEAGVERVAPLNDEWRQHFAA